MSLREEREYAQSAQAVLEKQRQRCLDVASALRDVIGFIRKSDLRPRELKMLADCEEYLDARRKPPASETAETTLQERAG